MIISEYKIVIISMEEHRYIYIYVPIAYKLSPLIMEFFWRVVKCKSVAVRGALNI